MRILFIGDVSGRPGRNTVKQVLPNLKNNEQIDFVIANCENAAGGISVNRKVLNELLSSGVDYFTSGDHIWKDPDFINELNNKNLPLVRPYNYEYEDQIPGKGYDIVEMGKQRIVIINVIGQTFMQEHVRNPFFIMDQLLERLDKEGIDIKKDVIFVDFHAEATAEKISLAYYLKDRITALVGTHTHVPTADERMISDHTAFVTDAGMAGPLDASLWASFIQIYHNFKYPFKLSKKMEMKGRRVFNSVLVETEGGHAISIRRVDRVLED